MDAFEQLVSEILWMEGNWVRTSVKVELTKDEKVRIGRPSSPRWELDVVAFHGSSNTLRVVECKSYIDSRGVSIAAFNGRNPKFAQRFKLFNHPELRAIVFERLRTQLAERGACPPDTLVRLCLACGRIASESDRAALQEHFQANGWELWDEAWLRARLKAVADSGYENQISAVVAKLLLRSPETAISD